MACYYTITGTDDQIYLAEINENSGSFSVFGQITTAFSPSVAVNKNGDIFIAVVDEKKQIQILTCQNDGVINSTSIIEGFSTNYSVSITFQGDNLYCALIDVDGLPHLILYKEGEIQELPVNSNLKSISAPVILAFHNILFYGLVNEDKVPMLAICDLATCENETNFIFYPVGKEVTAIGISLAMFNGKLFYAFTAEDQQIYLASMDDLGFDFDLVDSNTVLTTFAPSLAVLGDKLACAIVGTDQQLYLASSKNGKMFSSFDNFNPGALSKASPNITDTKTVYFNSVSSPVEAIKVKNGFLMPTRANTIAHFQFALGSDDLAIQYILAYQAACQKTPNEWKVLLALVLKTEAIVTDEKGKQHEVKNELSEKDIKTAKKAFKLFKEYVFAATNGQMRIVEDYIEIADSLVVDKLDDGNFWLRDSKVFPNETTPFDKYNMVSYIFPINDMPSIYLGLAFLYGSYSSTGCVLLKNSVRQTAAVQLHEFLHVTAGMAKSIGYKATPDVHWGPGWTSSNGGIDGDNVWYRKTISSIYSDSFWQNVPLIKNARKRYNQKIAGNYFSWSKVKEDWQFELPQITAEFLQNRTQLSELKFDFIKLNDTCYQFLVNGFSPDEVLSPVITEAKANDLTFNNALTLSTPVYPPEISDPWGGYKTHPIESMAVIRYKTHDSYKDLVFIRIEVADAVLERFKIREIPASEQILGYVTTIFDNDEFNSSPFLLVEIDLGETFPASELAAIGVNEDRYVDHFHAVASCDVPYQEDFEPQAAVDSFGQTYFWSTREFYENETFTVDFEKVLEANQIVSVQQASKSHPADFIRNGAFEISLDGENWEEIARISKKNFEVTITQEFRYVRLKALSNTEHWIAIRDISLGPLQREFDGYLPIGKVCGR